MEIFRKSRKVTETPVHRVGWPEEVPKASFDEVIKDFSSYTTVHGFQFLFRSQSRFRRIIWVCLLIACFCVLVVQFVTSLQKYRSHPSVISREILKAPLLTFPAVSICNQNIMKKSKIRGTDAQAYLDHLNRLKKVKANMSPEFDIEKAVLENGHNISDMVLSCSWGPKKCGPQNFTVFFSFWRGLCYTFNSGNQGLPLVRVTTSGRMQGLSLYLNAESDEYYGPYSYDTTGFKVYVHDQKELPNMEDNAYDISPGFNTIIRITRRKMISLGYPFAMGCGEKPLRHHRTYSQTACLQECYTNILVRNCGCRVLSLPGDQKLCNVTMMKTCVFPSFASHNPSKCDCPVPCERLHFLTEISTGYYPSQSLMDELPWIHGSKNKTGPITLEAFRRSFGHLTIFYKTTVTDIIREQPSYLMTDLGSDIGGNMGLFLGCSLLTVCEIIDLVLIGLSTWWRRPGNGGM